VGIKGKEGLQASRAADYVVVLFNALQRLVLVHGRYSYYRTSLVAQYSFYKSFLFCFLQIGYGFLSGYSGVSMFNSLCVAAYNALLFVPVVFFFVDKDLEEDTVLSTPQAYVTTREGRLMNLKTFGVWFARAFVQSFIVMAIGLSIVPGTDSAAYESMGLLIFNGYLLLQVVFRVRLGVFLVSSLTCVATGRHHAAGAPWNCGAQSGVRVRPAPHCNHRVDHCQQQHGLLFVRT
jgi:phospholipid-translocating ATPase